MLRIGPIFSALLFIATATVSAQVQPTTPQVPHPYWVKAYGQGIKHNLFQPTCVTFDQQGRLWLANRVGTILRIEDKNRDGVMDMPGYTFPVNPATLPSLEGLLFVGSDLWVSYLGNIGVFKDTNKDGNPDPVFTLIIPSIPVNLHQNNQMALGSNGWIHVGVGALHNHAPGGSNLATILCFNPAATNPLSTLKIFARGLRNVYDICFDDKGNLFGTDNCRDDMGLQAPPEELNHIVNGGFYGFPTQGTGTIAPVHNYPPHSSPCGLAFYDHDRFPGFAGSLLVTLFKSLPSFVAVSTVKNTRKVTRVELIPSGKTFTTKVTDWVTAFGNADPPVDLAVSPDGEVFVATHVSNTLGIPDSSLFKISHPYLKLDGATKINTTIEIQTWAKPMWAAFVFFSRPAPPIPTPFGNFCLDLATLTLLSSGVSPADDVFRTKLSIPNDPVLINAKIATQSMVGPQTNISQMVLTNAKTFTIIK